MKKFILLLSIVALFCQSTFAQTGGLNFQGIARNASGAVLANQKVNLKFSILKMTETGDVEYTETKETTTNAQGIFAVVMGEVNASSFAAIDWKQAPKFLKVEMDPAGGTSFVSMGTTRLQNVPFAYYANGVNASNIDGAVPVSKGGTGAIDAAAARTNLGLVIGTNVQAPLTAGTDYLTPTGNAATATKFAAAKKINGVDFDGSADISITATADASTLSGTVAIAKGGTGATDAAAARTNLGLAIGTNVQAPLTAGTDYLTPTGSAANLTNFPTLNQNTTGNASSATKLSTARKLNGVAFDGSADITVAADAGTLTGTVALVNGGTGATTAAAARTNLGLVIGTNVQAPLIAGTDYLAPTGSAANLTNFPTLNQNTTGNAASATIAGNISATSNTTLTSLSNLNTVGTITTGAWSGTVISIEKGGTGLNVSGTSGQVLFSTGSGTLTWTTPTSVTVGTISSTSNVNGAILTEGVLRLTPADATNGGIVTAGSQSFSGNKEIIGNLTISRTLGNETLDQSYTSGVFSTGTYTNFWQSFTAGISGVLTKVSLQFYNCQATGTLYLYQGTGTNGTLLTSQAFTISTLGQEVMIDFPLSSPVNVQSNLVYTMVFVANSGTIWGIYGAQNGYAGGISYVGNTLSTISNSSRPLLFKTFVSQGNGGSLSAGVGSSTIAGSLVVGGSAATGTSAALEVKSSTQGFLPPRMRAGQRDSIPSPVQGLVVYCTNCGSRGELEVYNGVAWVNLLGNTAQSVPAAPGTNTYSYSFVATLTNGSYVFSVYKFDGSSWAYVGASPVSDRTGAYIGELNNIHYSYIYNGTSYSTYAFNGTTWSLLSNTGTGPSGIYGGFMGVINNKIYHLGYNGTANVTYSFNGTTWQIESTTGSQPSSLYGGYLGTYNSVSYFAGYNGNTTSLYSFNGTTWALISSLSNGYTFLGQLGNTSYLSYYNGSSYSYSTFNGTTFSSWTPTGLPSGVSGYNFNYMGVLNNKLYTSISNNSTDARTLYSFDGTSFTNLSSITNPGNFYGGFNCYMCSQYFIGGNLK